MAIILDFLPYICEKFPEYQGRIQCAFPGLESARAFFDKNSQDIEECMVIFEDNRCLFWKRTPEQKRIFPD